MDASCFLEYLGTLVLVLEIAGFLGRIGSGSSLNFTPDFGIDFCWPAEKSVLVDELSSCFY